MTLERLACLTFKPDPGSTGEGGLLLVSGGDDQAIHVAWLSLEWPRGGGPPRVQCRATLRVPNAHGSAVRVRACTVSHVPCESRMPRLPHTRAQTLPVRDWDWGLLLKSRSACSFAGKAQRASTDSSKCRKLWTPFSFREATSLQESGP